MRRVLILQAGSANPAVRARWGDYPAWFARLLAPHVELKVVCPYREPIPPLASFYGVLMTGSPRSVTAPEPWMEDSAAYMLAAARTRPVLGVCFGHQLLARALGGRVERNPRGREAGTVEVHLTEAGARDPLFAGIPATFPAQQTHADHVLELPRGAALLARNDFSPVQAFGVGESIRCLQFHPEMDAERCRHLSETRRELLDDEAPGGSLAVLASIGVTPEAERCLRNWVARFVGA
jgi:GMP synthase (glutamine-hydrolysing)